MERQQAKTDFRQNLIENYEQPFATKFENLD